MKSDDEIMADHLLQGARMLARACPDCGCPLFEQKGQTTCVVCSARREAAGAEDAAGAGSGAPVTDAVAERGPQPARPSVPGALESELTATLAYLLERIRVEPDPERCRTLMACVSAGWSLLGRQ